MQHVVKESKRGKKWKEDDYQQDEWKKQKTFPAEGKENDSPPSLTRTMCVMILTE